MATAAVDGGEGGGEGCGGGRKREPQRERQSGIDRAVQPQSARTQ